MIDSYYSNGNKNNTLKVGYFDGNNNCRWRRSQLFFAWEVWCCVIKFQQNIELSNFLFSTLIHIEVNEVNLPLLFRPIVSLHVVGHFSTPFVTNHLDRFTVTTARLQQTTSINVIVESATKRQLVKWTSIEYYDTNSHYRIGKHYEKLEAK